MKKTILFAFFTVLFASFVFILSTQQASAINCGDPCIIGNCHGYWECSAGGYCNIGYAGGDCGGSQPYCGDGACNGGENEANCPADCKKGPDPKPCKPQPINYCDPTVMCGDPDSCGNKIVGRCKGEKQACDPDTKKCKVVNFSSASDPDADSYDPLYVKATTKGKNGPFTDRCIDSKTVAEYFFGDLSGNVGRKDCVCNNGCLNGACQGCYNDKHCKANEKCNQQTHKCEKSCVPTKTCKDYAKKGQCGLLLDDGCGQYLSCLDDDCPKNQYCDTVNEICVGEPARNCCVGLYGGDIKNGESKDLDEVLCNTFKDEYFCKGNLLPNGDRCFWDERKKVCRSSFAGVVADMIRRDPENPKCDLIEYIYVKNYDQAVFETTDFFESNNCSASRFRIFGVKHGFPDSCEPIYGYIKACVECLSGKCEELDVDIMSCSVLQKIQDGDILAEKIRNAIVKLGPEKNIKTLLTLDGSVITQCTRTPIRKEIDFFGIKTFLSHCDTLYKYNDELPKTGGCSGLNSKAARFETVPCIKSDDTRGTAKCCPVYKDNSDTVWDWTPVSNDNSSCPLETPLCAKIDKQDCASKDIDKTISCKEFNGRINSAICCGGKDINIDKIRSIYDPRDMQWRVGHTTCPLPSCEYIAVPRNGIDRGVICTDTQIKDSEKAQCRSNVDGSIKDIMCCEVNELYVYPLGDTWPRTKRWITVARGASKCPAKGVLKCDSFINKQCNKITAEQEKIICKKNNNSKYSMCCESMEPEQENGVIYSNFKYKWILTSSITNPRCPMRPAVACSVFDGKKCSAITSKDVICKQGKNAKIARCCSSLGAFEGYWEIIGAKDSKCSGIVAVNIEKPKFSLLRSIASLFNAVMTGIVKFFTLK